MMSAAVLRKEGLMNGKSGILKLSAAMLIFGSIGIFVRHIPLPSGAVAAARGVIGTLFLLVLLAVKQHSLSRDVKSKLPLLCISGVCIGINWILLFEAYRYTTVAAATLCYYMAPVLVISASPLILKERLTLRKIVCGLAAVLGMVFVSGILSDGLNGGSDMRGIAFGLSAAAVYAAVVLMNKRAGDIPAFDMTVVQLGSAAVVLVPYTLLKEDISSEMLSIKTVLLLLAVGIIHTGFAYALYFSAIKELKAQTAAIFSYLDPLVAVLLSALLLKENMGVDIIIGGVLIIGSAVISEISSKKEAEIN